MRNGLRSIVTGVLVLGLLAGCTGGEDPAGTTSIGGVGEDTSVGEVGEAIGADVPIEELERYAAGLAEAFGPPNGFVRLWRALDRGYTLEQLVFEGAGALDADGSLPGVDPAGPPRGLLSDGPVALGAPAGMPLAAPAADCDDGGPDSVFELFESSLCEAFETAVQGVVDDDGEGATQAEFDVLIRTLLLYRLGYSLEQVRDALILGTTRIYAGCPVIEGERPAREGAAGPCQRQVDEVSAGAVDLDEEGVGTGTEPTAGPAPVEDGTFRGQVDPGMFPVLTEPGSTATLEVNQVTVDVSGGRAALTVRWELDDVPIDLECTSDRVQVVESVGPGGFADGIALIEATATASDTFSGDGCGGRTPTEVTSPVLVRVAGTGDDGLLLEVLDLEGEVSYAVPLARG